MVSGRKVLTSDYEADLSGLSANIATKYVKLAKNDVETIRFIEECVNDHDSIIYGVKNYIASFLKKNFKFSQTDANAITRRGQMFVVSPAQVKTMYPSFDGYESLSMLDIGAGDGSITQLFVSYFADKITHLVCTESSPYMISRLKSIKTSFNTSLNVYNPESLPKETYDLILCFNVLDRCSKPSELLTQMISQLKNNKSIIVLAVVFPWCPFVEKDQSQIQPEEKLVFMEGYSCKDKASFEASLDRFSTHFLEKNNLDIISWSKVPYICKGDRNSATYTLADAVFVLRKKLI